MKGKLIFPLLIVIVIVLWVANLFAMNYISVSPEIMAAYGDMFGAVGALFNGLAFAAIAYTIYLQRQDMKRFHLDMELKEEELKRIRREEKIREELLKPNFTFGKGGIADNAFNIEIENVGPTVNFMNYREVKGTLRKLTCIQKNLNLIRDKL